MSQCVPSWGLDEPPNPPSRLLPSSSGPQGPVPDFELAELTWENGQLSKHCLGSRPRVGKPAAKYPDTATGTLESVVDQATRHHLHHVGGRPPAPAAAVEALVPSCQNPDAVDFASGIGSCGSGVRRVGNKRAREEESATDDFGFTTTSATLSPEDGGGSPETENASFAGGGGGGGHDSVCHSRRSQSQREGLGEEEEEKGPTNNSKGQTVRSICTKRSRAAAIHNQSERKRRDKINQRMRTLQKLVPNSSKTDKASMLDEVIEYLKQLQAQVQMMSRMSSIPTPLMMPMSMQQLQMSMMAQMAQMAQLAHMGLGMGIMDMNSLSRAGPAGIPAAAPFVPAVVGGGTMVPESFSAFRACPTQQPVSVDAHQRMAALYQQLYQLNPPSVPKT